MTPRQRFDVLIRVLKALVAERGGDPSEVDREYRWPQTETVRAAERAQSPTSMSALLTGSL